MPKQISDQMREALKLIKRGKSPQQAADLAGVKRQSIYASSAYKKLVAARAAPKEKAPYTHWMPIPAAPTPPASPSPDQ